MIQRNVATTVITYVIINITVVTINRTIVPINRTIFSINKTVVTINKTCYKNRNTCNRIQGDLRNLYIHIYIKKSKMNVMN